MIKLKQIINETKSNLKEYGGEVKISKHSDNMIYYASKEYDLDYEIAANFLINLGSIKLNEIICSKKNNN